MFTLLTLIFEFSSFYVLAADLTINITHVLWSQLVINVHILNTDKIVFIHEKNLSQSLELDLTLINFKLEAFIQSVIDHCQNIKLSLKSHDLINSYSRVIQNNHCFYYMLQCLIETSWNFSIWKLRCKDKTFSVSSNLLIQIRATVLINLISVNILINNISVSIYLNNNSVLTMFNNNSAVIHSDKHLSIIHLNNNSAITHINNNSVLTTLSNSSAVIHLNDNSSTAYLIINSAIIFINNNEAISDTDTQSSVLSITALKLSDDSISSCVFYSPQLDLNPESLNIHDHNNHHSSSEDTLNILNLIKDILMSLNIVYKESFLFISDASMSQLKDLKNRILDHAANLIFKNSSVKLFTTNSKEI